MMNFMWPFLVNLTPKALIPIYKSFIRLHLYYGGILYNKPNN